MSAENPFVMSEDVEVQERRATLLREMGISLSTRSKSGAFVGVEEQIVLIEEMGLKAVQFDFRNRLPQALEKAEEMLGTFRELHSDVAISIHGETPKIDEQTYKIKNADMVGREVDIAKKIEAESFTVHPPSVGQELFDETPIEVREKVIENYCALFAEKISGAAREGRRFSVAIENMSASGREGSWGQTPEDIKMLIQRIEEMLVSKYTIHPDIAREYIGATLDVNHALDVTEDVDQYPAVIESWFQELAEYIKVIHVYTPGDINPSVTRKLKATLDYAAQYSPDAHIFMESKQSPEITRHVYSSLKNKDI